MVRKAQDRPAKGHQPLPRSVITVSAEMHDQLKTLASQHGMKMHSLTEAVLRNGLKSVETILPKELTLHEAARL